MAYTVFFTDIFRLKRIILQGSEVLTIEQLFPETELPYIFQKIEINNPLVESFTIHKNLIDKTFTIDIKDRKPFGVWCTSNGVSSKKIVNSTSTVIKDLSHNYLADNIIDNGILNCYWFDKKGIIFAKAPSTTGMLVKSVYELSSRTIIIGMRALSDEEFQRIISIFETLELAEIGVSNFILPDLKYQEIHAYTPKGTIIYFSLRLDPTFSLEPLRSLKPKIDELRYIDLMSENKVFYK